MPYKHKVAVLGAGLTRFMRRAQETPKELAFEAAKAALEDAGLTIDDIDCVVCVTGPRRLRRRTHERRVFGRWRGRSEQALHA